MSAPVAVRTPGARACAKWPDLHHPIGYGKPAVRQALAAIEVCVECPLMLACRAGADARAASGEQLDEIAGGWDYNDNRRSATAVLLGVARADAERARRRNQPKCGTQYGYKLHRARKEDACDPCKAANTEANAKRKAAREAGKPGRRTGRPAGRLTDIEHGTTRGYAAHRRRGIPTCAPCRAANAAAVREYSQRQTAPAQPAAVAS